MANFPGLQLKNLNSYFPSLAKVQGDPQQTAGNLLVAVIQILLGFAAVLALAAIIIGAVMFIVSIGNEQRVATAKKVIFWAIAGLLVIGFAFAVLALIGTVFGVA